MTERAEGDVTRILSAAGAGDAHAAGQAFELVYGELRRLAQHMMQDERANHTLQATALVNEAYLRLLGEAEQGFEGRAHFFTSAARAMRRLLIDHARKRNADRRGGGRQRVALDLAEAGAIEDPGDLLAIEDALCRLEAIDPQQCRVVELRFFAGLTNEQAAEVLGVSERTVYREWRTAQAWLRAELAD